MRSQQDIIDDPQAPEEEILLLSSKDQLRHPNCPPSLWWNHAARHPLIALNSPLYSLLVLEHPEAWEEHERQFASNWIEKYWREASQEAVCAYATACFTHAIEQLKLSPKVKLIVDICLLQYRKFCATGFEDDEAFETTMGKLIGRIPTRPHALFEFAQGFLQTDPGSNCASAVAYACAETDGAYTDDDIFQAAHMRETVWQWRTLLQLMRGSP